MREIKFRALTLHGYLTYFSIFEIGNIYEDDQVFYTKNGMACKIDTIAEFTGLKDKNKAEAYHKDIVSAYGYSNWIIELHENSWKLKQIGRDFYMEIPEDFIIIANAYENPELLREDEEIVRAE